jgi:hypothetical protein
MYHDAATKNAPASRQIPENRIRPVKLPFSLSMSAPWIGRPVRHLWQVISITMLQNHYEMTYANELIAMNVPSISPSSLICPPQSWTKAGVIIETKAPLVNP